MRRMKKGSRDTRKPATPQKRARKNTCRAARRQRRICGALCGEGRCAHHEPELEHFVAIPAVVPEDIEAVGDMVVAVRVDDAMDFLAEVVISLKGREISEWI